MSTQKSGDSDIGQIIFVINHRDFDINYMRKNGQYFSFPAIDDVSQANRSEIEAILPVPKGVPGSARMIGFRYTFDTDFSRFNMRQKVCDCNYKFD